jgi:phosphate transport system protein
MPQSQSSTSNVTPEPRRSFDAEVRSLKERLLREATLAIGMLEGALEALWKLDRPGAQAIRERDERVDAEEVAIEECALRLLTLQAPVARDLRLLTFVLKVNSDLERIADHAKSIAKVVKKFPEGSPPVWPTALVELGQRVPMACHQLLRALHDEDPETARAIVANDATIDALHRQLFAETLDLMGTRPNSQATGLLVYRLGRELERVGDLLTNIAEDIIFLRTGQIVRHERKKVGIQGQV